MATNDTTDNGENEQPKCSECGDLAVVKGEAWHPVYGISPAYACEDHWDRIKITGSVSAGDCDA